MPTLTRHINTSPDANGIVYNEQWDSSFIERYFNHLSFATGDMPSVSHIVINNDDGPMGSKFASMGTEYPWGWNFGNTFFDPRQPVTIQHKFRVKNEGGEFQGLGLFYNGETWYGGPCMLGESAGKPSIGFYNLPVVGTVDYNTVHTMDIEWNPTAKTYRARIDGGSWAGQTNDPYTQPIGGAATKPYWKWPVSIYFATDTTGTSWPEIGLLKVSGSVMYGACDWNGFEFWDRTNCAIWQYQENAGILGGLTGKLDDNSPYIWQNTSEGVPVNQDWSANSPKLLPSYGYKPNQLYFEVYNADSSLKIQVRYEDDDSLVSDGILTGNSTNLIPEGVLVSDAIMASATLKSVDLSGIDYARNIYLSVQGHTEDTMTIATQPRIGGVWVSFMLDPTAPVFETADVGFANAIGSINPLTAPFTRYMTAEVKPAIATGSINKLDAAYSRYFTSEVKAANAFGSISKLTASVGGLSPLMYQIKGPGGATYPFYIKTQ